MNPYKRSIDGIGTTYWAGVVLLSILYVVLSMLSNLSSLRIIKVLTLSMDAGSLFYPLTFVLRDMLHQKTNLTLTNRVVVYAGLNNFLMFSIIYVVSVLPADPAVGPQTAFGQVLLPSIRIILGSVIAGVTAELLDGLIYQAVQRRFGEKRRYLRVVLSNAVSIPFDTAIMSTIAFYGLIDNATLISVTWSNILLKYAFSFILLPLFYLRIAKRQLDGSH
jgi:uncharacterized integral membrane protein (TIGR00697 family)